MWKNSSDMTSGPAAELSPSGSRPLVVFLEGELFDTTFARAEALTGAIEAYPAVASEPPSPVALARALGQNPWRDPVSFAVDHLCTALASRAGASAVARACVHEPLVRADYEALLWGEALCARLSGRSPPVHAPPGLLAAARPLDGAGELLADDRPLVGVAAWPRVELLQVLLAAELADRFVSLVCLEDVGGARSPAALLAAAGERLRELGYPDPAEVQASRARLSKRV